MTPFTHVTNIFYLFYTTSITTQILQSLFTLSQKTLSFQVK